MPRDYGFIGWAWRFAIAAIWDLLDFLLGWIPVVGDVWDVLGAVVSLALWGANWGTIAPGLEAIGVGPLDVIDGPFPSVTIAGIFALAQEMNT